MKKFLSKPSTILILLAALLYLFKLGSFSLYDAAETTYGEFVKNILRGGDWITLHYNGQIIFDKPPLYFWLAALLSKLIGFNAWAMRLWAAVAGMLTVLVTFLLGKKFYNPRAGFIAALVAMTAFQFMIQSRIAELDIVLTLLISFALLIFYHSYTTKQKNILLWAYLAMGLGILIKGILAVALPACAVLLFLLIKNELPRLKDLRLIPGILILLLVGFPWYLIEYLRHGKIFVDFALGFLFLSRFSGVVSGHTGPWYYYFPALLLGFAPWSQFLPFSLWLTFKNWRNDPELLMLCLIVPALLVFSIAKTKIPNYILPLYPFLAITVGRMVDQFLAEPEKYRREMNWSNFLLLIITGIIIAGVVMVGRQNYPAQYASLVPGLWLLAAVFIAGCLLSILLFFFRREAASLAAIVVMVFAIMLVLTLNLLPQVENFKGAKPLGERLAKIIKTDQAIGVFDVGNRPSVVLCSPQPVVFLNSEAQLRSFLREKRGYVFTTDDKYEKIKTDLRIRIFDKKGDLLLLYE